MWLSSAAASHSGAIISGYRICDLHDSRHQVPIPFPTQIEDGLALQAIGRQSLPTSLLVDPNGSIAHRHENVKSIGIREENRGSDK